MEKVGLGTILGPYAYESIFTNVPLQGMNLDNLIERIDEVSDTVNEVGMTVMEMEDKIQRELKSRINSIGIGIGDDDTSSLDAVDASVQGIKYTK